MGLLDIFKKKGTQEPEPTCSVEDVRALLKNPDDFFIQQRITFSEGVNPCRFEVQHKETGETFEIAAFPVKRGGF